jgi:chromate transporter
MVYFAWHVIWPGARFDVASAVIAAIAAALLVSKKLDVIPVIAASGAAGLALWMAGLQPAT